jgi:hypothetical protein
LKPISKLIAQNFGFPEGQLAFGQSSVSARMTVPEAAMNEYNLMPTNKRQIRFAG